MKSEKQNAVPELGQNQTAKIDSLKAKIEQQKSMFEELANLFKTQELFLGIKKRIAELKKAMIDGKNDIENPKIKLLLIQKETEYRDKTEFGISNTELVSLFLDNLEERTISKLKEIEEKICAVSSAA